MSELSPAAQAVLDALCVDELNGSQQLVARAHAAAALRAAADQVVPKRDMPRYVSEATRADWFARDDVHDDLLLIANELASELEAQ